MLARLLLTLGLVWCTALPAAAQLDKLLNKIPLGQQSGAGIGAGLSDAKIGSGLKEALQVGTENTVNLTGRENGYFANQAIKILMPKELQTLEQGLRLVGYGPQVDEFVLSMNRAAEKAAPFAKDIFWDAITAMTFVDVRRIWSGGDTAATEYFQDKTTTKLTKAFRPVVRRSMNNVGVTRQYNALMKQYQHLPFVQDIAFDVNGYVIGKALDGLFHVLGEEEKKIRINPAARVTELLQEVFAK